MIEKQGTLNYWTDEEDELMRKHYPKGGSALVMKYVHRTRNAVQNRACRLGLELAVKRQMPNLKPDAWSAEEDEVIRLYYKSLGSKGVGEKLRRSTRAIWSRATDLGVSCDLSAKKWTPEEDSILRKHYPKHGCAYVSEVLGRPFNGTKRRAALLGVRFEKSKEQIEKHCMAMVAAREAARAGRSEQKAERKLIVTTCDPKEWDGQGIITKQTKLTVAPPFSDDRYRVTSAPRVIDSNQCRDWARNA